MARIRTIKPDLFKHEGLYDLEVETGLPIRAAFMGLLTCADREGRFKWRPRTLKSDVLPHDQVDFSRVLDALATRGFIVRYASEDEEYGFFPTWKDHQYINNRESASTIPKPPDDIEIPRVPHASPTRQTNARVEGERKGRGKEGERKEYDADASIPFEEIISHLNQQAGTEYRHTSEKSRKFIRLRWNEGFTLDDFKKVNENKILDWKGDPKMEAFIRPETLYGTKFESYLNQLFSPHSNVAYKTMAAGMRALSEDEDGKH